MANHTLSSDRRLYRRAERLGVAHTSTDEWGVEHLHCNGNRWRRNSDGSLTPKQRCVLNHAIHDAIAAVLYQSSRPVIAATPDLEVLL